MLSFLFILVFIGSLIYFFFLCKISGINLFKPGIISVFLIMYITFSYIGIFPLFFGLDELRVAMGVNNQLNVLKLWLYSCIGLVSVFLGFLFSHKFFNLDINLEQSFNSEHKELSISTKFFVIISFFICSIVFILYLLKLPSIPIVELIKGASDSQVKVLRTEATTGFNGAYHWYALFFNSIMTFLCFVVFSEALKTKSKINIFFFLMIVSISFFAQITPTHKAPAIWLVIGLLITYIIVKNKTISFKHLFSFGIIALPVLVFMYKYFMGYENRSITEIINNIFSRTLTGQLTPAYFYLEIFPEEINYLLGRSFPNPGGIFPFENFHLTVEVANYINPDLVNSDVVGTAPAVFWAEMYANFGGLAVVLSSIIVGVILFIIQFYVLRLPKSSLSIGLNVWLMLEFQKLAITGLSSFLLNIDLFSVLILGLILVKFENGTRNKSELNREVIQRYKYVNHL